MWRPMPATAREPSAGTRVLVLCGRRCKTRACGRRCRSSARPFRAPRAVMMDSRSSMRAAMSSPRPSFFSRFWRWRGDDGRRSGRPGGAATSSGRGWACSIRRPNGRPRPRAKTCNNNNVPGRTSAPSQLLPSGIPMTWRFSSTTRISCSPSAKSRVMPALQRPDHVHLVQPRMPSRRQVVIQPQVGQRPAHAVAGLLPGDDAKSDPGAWRPRCSELAGAAHRPGRIPPCSPSGASWPRGGVGQRDVQAARRHHEVPGRMMFTRSGSTSPTARRSTTS